MKSKGRQEEQEGDGLDSLLDTMTNVVGILVMVLIATQLGVKDAVDRISETTVVDEAAMEEAREKAQQAEQKRQEILAKLNSRDPDDGRAVEVELADLRRQRQQVQVQINQEQQASNQYALKIEQDKQKAAQAKQKLKKLADDKKTRDSLQNELTESLEEEARLKALLDDTPAQSAPPAKVVTLPDPRGAPEGAREIVFLCTKNLVYPVAADDRRTEIREAAEALVKAKRLDGGPKVGVNKERFMKEFSKYSRKIMQDDFFTIELFVANIYPRLRFTPRDKKGADVAEVAKRRSRFQKLLQSLDRDKYYARFIVLPDSFEAYLTARAVADEIGLLAGWEPQGENWEYTTHLGGSILFGPKPEPKPAGKPVKPPPKRKDVID
ncbi:MAG: hypothetical protein GTO53_04690 [Planctomycetales bacterium]|nr:hypothetical protein [Planctomycetales bacterium]NIM08453.1 hypothetical protein [Planctomycetales bacterium]NIN07929.1 hypothetical protein [Planctomycetales bacterium]NIN77058.1 hypothetical protein [Planctomycetales bacterium]NIO34243.1 hypothetical protein [Planctomycetales bacterium]